MSYMIGDSITDPLMKLFVLSVNNNMNSDNENHLISLETICLSLFLGNCRTLQKIFQFTQKI